MNPKDLLGMKFSRLTVIARDENNKSKKPHWFCKCDCGKIKEKSVNSYDLINGRTRSCGCLQKEHLKGLNKTHGLLNHKIYHIRQSMVQRCYYPKNNRYHMYGERGIKVCDEWLGSSGLVNFYNWAMANGYDENAPRGQCTIDRIDVNGDYCPENCRWATMKEQQNNRTNNRIISYGDKLYTISELSDELKIPYKTLAYRINHGWSEKDLGLPINKNKKEL